MSDLYSVTISPTLAKDFSQDDMQLSLDDYSNLIEVIVGTGKEQVRVFRPAKILGLESKYFRDACFPIWPIEKYSKLKEIHLDQDITAFNIFLAWNTTRNIQMSKQIQRVDGNDSPDTKLEKYEILWDQLLECHFLSEYLEAPNFGNSIINAMVKAQQDERAVREHIKDTSVVVDEDVENGSQRPIVEMHRILGCRNYQINRLYEKTKAPSLLRAMMVDKILAWCRYCERHTKLDAILNENLEAGETAVSFEFTKDLINEFANGLIDYRRAVDTWFKADCEYHKHKNGESCGVDSDDSN